MHDRLTNRARKVLNLAHQEAQRFNHEYIGTEHILLGLVKESSGVASNVLRTLDFSLGSGRVEVEKIVQCGSTNVVAGKILQTPHCKKVLEWSWEEAQKLNHQYIGTEHLLLALMRDTNGIVAQVLCSHGITPEEVTKETLYVLGYGEERATEPNAYLTDEAMQALDNLRLVLGKKNLSHTAITLLSYYVDKEGLPQHWQPTHQLIKQCWDLMFEYGPESEQVESFVEKHSYDKEFIRLGGTYRTLAEEIRRAPPIIQYLLLLQGSGSNKKSLANDLFTKYATDEMFLRLASAAQVVFELEK